MTSLNGELTFTVQVEQVQPGAFVARVLALPNLLTLGDTGEQAIARAREVLGYYVRQARARGEPAPIDRPDRCVASAACVPVNVAA
jgi:predicted RNase H-like HicB family nuclease